MAEIAQEDPELSSAHLVFNYSGPDEQCRDRFRLINQGNKHDQDVFNEFVEVISYEDIGRAYFVICWYFKKGTQSRKVGILEPPLCVFRCFLTSLPLAPT